MTNEEEFSCPFMSPAPLGFFCNIKVNTLKQFYCTNHDSQITNHLFTYTIHQLYFMIGFNINYINYQEVI